MIVAEDLGPDQDEAVAEFRDHRVNVASTNHHPRPGRGASDTGRLPC